MCCAIFRFAVGLLSALAIAALALRASVPLSPLPERCRPFTRAAFQQISEQYANHTRAFSEGRPPLVVYNLMSEYVTIRTLRRDPVLSIDEAAAQCPNVHSLVCSRFSSHSLVAALSEGTLHDHPRPCAAIREFARLHARSVSIRSQRCSPVLFDDIPALLSGSDIP
jgi:hypothetical protein